jgi:hypothetical protein
VKPVFLPPLTETGYPTGNLMKKSEKITVMIMLTAAIAICLDLIAAKSFYEKILNSDKVTYNLGTNSQYGYVGVKVYYDSEPVDISLMSPSGLVYSEKQMNIYEIDTEGMTMTALIDTSETGEWKVMLNKKSNSALKYAFMVQPSLTIHIEDARVTEIDGKPYVSFMPIMSTENTDKCKYSLTLRNSNYSLPLATGTTPLNEKTFIPVEANDSAYNGSSYTIRLAVSSMEDEATSDYADLAIVLYRKPATQDVSNNETENTLENIE